MSSPFPTPSPVLRIKLIHGVSDDLDISSRFYLAYSGSTPTVAGCTAIGTAVGTEWNGQLSGLLNTSGLLSGVDVEDVSSTSGAAALATVSHDGARSGSVNPINLCAVLGKKIARRYRGGKPRMYLPYGVLSDQSSSFTWSTTFAALVSTAWADFIAGLTGTTVDGTELGAEVNVGFYKGSTPYTRSNGKTGYRPTPIDPPFVDLITGYETDLDFGSQRRRIKAS